MADCRVSDDRQSALVTYALGSCLALTGYDPVARIGGLLHYMLPDSSLDAAGRQSNPFKFADTGIPRLLEDICEQGASKWRLVICMAGAAQILDDKRLFEIGKRNYLATRRLLWKHALLVANEAVGGWFSNSLVGNRERAGGDAGGGLPPRTEPGALKKGNQSWNGTPFRLTLRWYRNTRPILEGGAVLSLNQWGRILTVALDNNLSHCEIRVLIVDDSSIVRKILNDALSGEPDLRWWALRRIRT